MEMVKHYLGLNGSDKDFSNKGITHGKGSVGTTSKCFGALNGFNIEIDHYYICVIKIEQFILFIY